MLNSNSCLTVSFSSFIPSQDTEEPLKQLDTSKSFLKVNFYWLPYIFKGGRGMNWPGFSVLHTGHFQTNRFHRFPFAAAVDTKACTFSTNFPDIMAVLATDLYAFPSTELALHWFWGRGIMAITCDFLAPEFFVCLFLLHGCAI